MEFLLCFLGAIALGLVPVPCSAQLTERETVKIIQNLAQVSILHNPALACPAIARLPGAAYQILDVATLRTLRQGPLACCVRDNPNRLAYLIYTSGTCGDPQAVMHAHRTIWARRMMGSDWADIRFLHAGAFNWTYTLGTGLLDPWRCGATAVIANTPGDIASLPHLLAAHNITIFAAALGVFRKILVAGDAQSLPKLHHALSAGEKMTDALQQAWTSTTGAPVYEAYDMSECSNFISASPSHPARSGRVGRPQTGRRVAIVDTEEPVAIGTQGMIAVS